MNTRNLWSLGVVLVSGLGLGSCSWVDSAGNGDDPVVTQVFLDDIPVGTAKSINEQSVARITAELNASSLEQSFSWSEEPLEQGNLPACAEEDGFKPDLAADTLGQACKAGTNCELNFERQDASPDADVVEFDLQIPALNASVGLRYALIVEDSSGRVFNSEYSFCLIAINEAPVANDDTFVILEGTVLNVTPATVNLMSNDSDDIGDVSNTEFVVIPEPLSGPEHAAFFELGNDGSFTYQSSLSDLREDQFDVFEYQLSDGVFISTAKATIRVVAANQAPRLIAPIPVLSATEGDSFTANLGENFIDPENGTLTFTLSSETPLARGTGLALGRNGVLEGIPTAADVGIYQLDLLVSDGGRITEATLRLEVAETTNRAPVFVAGSLLPEVVGPRLIIMRITPRFTDPDNDPLTYSMDDDGGALPPGLSINRLTGIISGRPSAAGVYGELRAKATDPSGVSTLSSVFTVTVLAN
ncbi:MAG: putative Ig domain-containing protein [Granulosicoccus sp.]